MGVTAKMKINLNDIIKVKLTDHGTEVWIDYYKNLIKDDSIADKRPYIRNRWPDPDDDGYVSIQLWKFMQIFGEHLAMMDFPVILPAEIVVEEDAECKAQEEPEKPVTLGDIVKLASIKPDIKIDIMKGMDIEAIGLARSEIWNPHSNRRVTKLSARNDHIQVWLEE